MRGSLYSTARLLRFLSAGGIPAVRQSSHQFLLGRGAFDIVAMVGAKADEQRLVLEKRMEKWPGLFNDSMLPFC